MRSILSATAGSDFVGLHGSDRIVFDWRLPVHRDGDCKAEGTRSFARRANGLDHSGGAFAADGVSWVQSVRQARRQAKEYKLTCGATSSHQRSRVRAVFSKICRARGPMRRRRAALLLSELFRTSVPDSSRHSLSESCSRSRRSVWPGPSRISWWSGRYQLGAEKLHAMLKDDEAIEQILSLRAFIQGPKK